jgi:serine/threonine protein kinase/rRNA-processing protein FCF1
MAGTDVKAVGNTNSTRKSKATPFRLSKIDQSYLVFCDTCSLMADKASYVLIDGVGKVLEQQTIKLIIAKRVIDELYKHQANKSDTVLSKKAIGGLKIIQTFQKKGLCDIFEDKNDPFADQLFLSLFTKFRKSHNLLMITNDNNLAYDLLGLSDQKSVQSNKTIEVCFVGDDGDLIQYRQKTQINTNSTEKRSIDRTKTPVSPKFTVSKQLKAKYTVRNCKDIPEAGSVVYTDSGLKYNLEKKIAEGGEGSTYITDKGHVCKIYRKDRLTDDRYQKLMLMTASPIKYPGICWPEQIIYNSHKEFVGYLMPLAKGSLLQRCVFLPMLMQSTFPKWNRLNLVKLAITIVKKIEYLHDNNVIMGDINPLNIMVHTDEDVYFIDTDSYQIDGYPCPVGTVHFTAPEIQGKDFKTFLRTIDHEKYAVATLIFMILLPGKPPYSQLDGASPSENIRKQNFSFPLGEESNQKAPKGPWRFIWSHLSFALKEAFFDTFKNNKRLSASEWLSLLGKYKWNIEQGYNTDQLFPRQLKLVDPIEVNCDKCGCLYTASKEFIDKIAAEGKNPLCDKCREEIKAKVGGRTTSISKDMGSFQVPQKTGIGKIRVHELAKELKISTMALWKHLTDIGVVVNSHMSFVDDHIADRIRKSYHTRATPIPQQVYQQQPPSLKPQASLQPTPQRVQPISHPSNPPQNVSSSPGKKASGSGCLVPVVTFILSFALFYVIQLFI